MKIIGTGITGLIGSRIVELLSPKGFRFVNLSLETGVDISRLETIEDKFKDNPDASWVIHLAAKADVDACERDKEEDMKILLARRIPIKSGEGGGGKEIKQLSNEVIKEKAKDFYGRKTAWALNVVGTLNVADLCKNYNKRLIYISTDFVFDGKKSEKEAYREDDLPNPINFYAQTKYLGEKIVQNLLKKFIICRIAFPYRSNFFPKKDLVRGLSERLKTNQKVKMVTDQIITPTFIDDIVFSLELLIKKEAAGIYHLVGSSWLTPFEIANLIARYFGYNKELIEKTTREKFYQGRAPRPFNLKLSNDRIISLGIKMKTLEEGLNEVKQQLLRI